MKIFVSYDCKDSGQLIARIDEYLLQNGEKPVGIVVRDERGKPYCDNYKISITNTDGIIIVAISDKDVGVDIEKKTRKVVPVMQDIYNWTAMEAKAKLTGKGIELSRIRRGENFKDGITFSEDIDGYVIAIAGEDKSISIVIL